MVPGSARTMSLTVGGLRHNNPAGDATSVDILGTVAMHAVHAGDAVGATTAVLTALMNLMLRASPRQATSALLQGKPVPFCKANADYYSKEYPERFTAGSVSASANKARMAFEKEVAPEATKVSMELYSQYGDPDQWIPVGRCG